MEAVNSIILSGVGSGVLILWRWFSARLAKCEKEHAKCHKRLYVIEGRLGIDNEGEAS